MKEISVSKGKATMFVDDEDFEKVNQIKWYKMVAGVHIKKVYATTSINGKSTSAHRFIMNAKKGQIIDHIDGNGLNNQKANLRFCTVAENQHNRVGWTKKSSKYKGVYWGQRRKKWFAEIECGGKIVFREAYMDEKEAARVYNEMAVKYHGKFALLNKL